MNLTSPKFLSKEPQHSGQRLVRMFAAIVSVSILTAAPALADTVRVNQVVQSLTSSQGSADIKLSTLVTQDPVAPRTQGSTQENPSQATNKGGTKNESIISGVSVPSTTQQIGVDIDEEGEVEGTICDCGEILVAGGAFPKWPFLFLGAVPLVFINDCDDCDEPPRQESPTPTPTPTPTPPNNPTPTPTPPGVPEPATLLLFGTGLAAFGAGLRRRYARSKVSERSEVQEEE